MYPICCIIGSAVVAGAVAWFMTRNIYAERAATSRLQDSAKILGLCGMCRVATLALQKIADVTDDQEALDVANLALADLDRRALDIAAAVGLKPLTPA